MPRCSLPPRRHARTTRCHRTARPGAYFAVVLLLLCCAATEAGAQQAYYFSPTGDDATGDGTAAHPWATTGRANDLDLEPGDSLRFEGGATFDGGLYLDAEDAGLPDHPVVVDSYGEGRATLEASDDFGIFVYNAGGIKVRNLVVVGSGLASNEHDGIAFYLDLPGGVMLDYLRVVRVEVSGFGKSGLSIGAWNGDAGWRNVRVTGSAFHGNANGMQTFAERKGALEDVYIGHCRFYGNPGHAGTSGPSGNGLVIGQVDGAVVERSLAYGNGASNTSHAGPVGIWAYDANDIVIQHNEAYENRTDRRDGSGDGGGFDLDGGVTNSVLQYNYSHDNDGAGYGLFQYAGAAPSGGNVVRFNISEDDGRANGYGGISVWGASAGDPVGPTEIYHNTIYMSPAAHGNPPAIEIKNQHHDGLAFRNNVLVAASGARLVKSPASPGLRFEGNAYWGGGDAFAIKWGGTTYGSLEDWRSATAQERLLDALGGGETGMEGDPLLSALGAGGTVGNADLLEDLLAYHLLPTSPLLGNALDLGSLFGLDPGPHDFFGTPLDATAPFSMGAHGPAPMVISGVIEDIDIEAHTLSVDGMAVMVTPETTIHDEGGGVLTFEDLHLGLLVEAAGIEVDPNMLVADRVVAEEAVTASAPDAVPDTAFSVASAFPNPAASRTALVLDLPGEAEVAVSVFDVLGREVLHRPSERLGAGNGQALPLDLNGLGRGSYVVRITAAGPNGTAATTVRLTVVG